MLFSVDFSLRKSNVKWFNRNILARRCLQRHRCPGGCVYSLIELFSLERRKVIGIALTAQPDWLQDSRHFFNQSEVKPKPIRIHSHEFSRALRKLHVIFRVLIGSLYYLRPLWLARVITLILVLRHSMENCSISDSITLGSPYLKMAMFCRVVDWGKPCDVFFSYQSESRAILRKNIRLKTVKLKLVSK